MSRNPSVSLTEHQQSFVESLVASGRYHGVSEVLRAGLRLLEDEETQRSLVLEELRTKVSEGLSDIKADRVHDFDPERIIAKGKAERSACSPSE